MAYVEYLRCSRCGSVYRLDEGKCLCDGGDLGRLDIHYDYDALSRAVTREKIVERAPGVWRYFEFLPVVDVRNVVSLGEGGTPLIRAGRLADRLGLKELYLKDETRNPTGSFKDRSMTVGVSKALEIGAKTVCTASSGNAAASLAAYSAKAGLACYAFVIEEASPGKLAQLQLYGARVYRVRRLREGVDPTVEMLRLAIRHYGWYPCPSFGPFNPYQVEGPKTISYEVVEQLGWDTPDWIFVPVGAACLLAGVWKGLRDFMELGWISEYPRLVGVQSTGNPPFVRAYEQGVDATQIKPWKNPETVATGLSDPYPWDADAGLQAIRETGGAAIAVSDEEILQAQQLLAFMEGIFAEPSGVVGLAALARMVDEGVVDAGDRVVVLITGTGLKDLEVVRRRFGKPETVSPTLDDLRRIASG
ncbi:MAG TPA: threonine synthase [Candidatus Bathyarchaeota archaeon]|nr:threonine synthase [Candidatus Bathyarchaeota archaeon]